VKVTGAFEHTGVLKTNSIREIAIGAGGTTLGGTELAFVSNLTITTTGASSGSIVAADTPDTSELFGSVYWVSNGTTKPAIIVHENGGSTANTRFYCPNSLDLVIPPNDSFIMFYDTVVDRWRAFASGSQAYHTDDSFPPLCV
jgi:hypothetical protein